MQHEEDRVKDLVASKWFSTILFGTLASLFFIGHLALEINLVVKLNAFNRGVTAHLEMAARASSIENAKTELQAALIYLDNETFLEKTQILQESPNLSSDRNARFWFNNLTVLFQKLETLKSQKITLLQEIEVLNRVKSTIMRQKEWGAEEVILPDNYISLEGQTVRWMSSVFLIVSIFFFVLCYASFKQAILFD
ncbi:hypothetical protein IQ272_30845 [Chroococcidiopsidales cyanobacterium LEGE 13417]|nr:hypothetical protein [Chroococcidiopsidales cyanobacterium LEGE 13417]